MSKKIGIVSWATGPNSFGVTTPYLEWLDTFGKVRILDFAEDFDGSIDLLVIPGGPDVDSTRYNQKPHRRTGKPCPYREYFDEFVLPIYIENNVPIFGVCRGLQAINVAFGGTLNQHKPHETSDPNKRWEIVHSVVYKILEPTNLVEYTAGVNSIHHQVVDKLGEGLKSIARYKPLKSKKTELGDVEAILHESLPIAGVQFHPEELMYNELANRLMNDLLEGIDNDKYLEV